MELNLLFTPGQKNQFFARSDSKMTLGKLEI
jgi:hypothetical protein